MAEEKKPVVIGIGDPLPALHNAEFINQIISQVWPSLNSAVQAAVKTQLIPKLHRKLKLLKHVLTVEKVNIGTEAPMITSVFVHPKADSRRDIVLDVDIKYEGNAEVKAYLLPVCFGVKDIQISGRIRILLGPQLPTLPLFAGVSIFFLRPPALRFDLTGLANLGDLPVIRSYLRHGINDAIAKELVYPNRVVTILSKDSGVTKEQLIYPDPQGMLRVTVVSVLDVDDTDLLSKPDIYVIVKIGGLEFRTKTVDNVRSATFNTTFEALLDQYEDCVLTVEIWDEDVGNDDALGCADINLSRVKDTPDLLLRLSNSKEATIKLKVVWREVSLLPANKILLSASTVDSQLLYVDLEELKGFDMSGNHSYQCDVQLGDSDNSLQTTKVAVLKGDPPNQVYSFDDHLQFLSVLEPDLVLVVKLVDSSPDDSDIIMGQFSVKMKDLLDSHGAEMKKVFPFDGLDGKGVEARLLLRAFQPK